MQNRHLPHGTQNTPENIAKRKAEYLEAGLRLAKTHGFESFSKTQLAAETKLSTPMVNFYFGTVKEFKAALMRLAVEREELDVIFQGLAVRHPEAEKASDELKAQVVGWLTARK